MNLMTYQFSNIYKLEKNCSSKENPKKTTLTSDSRNTTKSLIRIPKPRVSEYSLKTKIALRSRSTISIW